MYVSYSSGGRGPFPYLFGFLCEFDKQRTKLYIGTRSNQPLFPVSCMRRTPTAIVGKIKLNINIPPETIIQ